MNTTNPRERLSIPVISFVSMAIVFLLLSATSVYAQSAQPRSISALGRLEPEGGIVRVAAPSTPEAISGSIVHSLHVREGQNVEKGALLAITDSAAVMTARKEQMEAEYQTSLRASEASKSEANEACVLADVADREAQRRVSLLAQKLAAEEETEFALGKAEATAASCKAAHARARVASSEVDVARSHVTTAQAELDRAYIKAPFKGQILHLLVQPGELIKLDGLLELARTNKMYAIAEVYETDIRHVKVGQSASISSKALSEELHGKVELIRHKVQKHDVTGTDPAAAKDARIIEVEILLDNPEPAASLSHLQVEIIIDI